MVGPPPSCEEESEENMPPMAAMNDERTTLDQYVRSRQVNLARSLSGRAKIYLDTRFWIIARDVASGVCTGAVEQELLLLLRRGVADGKMFCPISEGIFVELMKQKNTSSRRLGTARLIDELSLGVSITTHQSRIATEIAHFIYSTCGENNIYDVEELVWTKLSYALGYVHPSMPGREKNSILQLQKSFFDMMWEIPLSKMVGMVGDERSARDSRLPDRVKEMNANIAAHAHTLRSFQQTYRSEIAGAAEVCSHVAADVMCAIADRTIGSSPPKGSEQWENTRHTFRNLLIAVFEKPIVRRALRTMHIYACLHANLRWNKGRQLEVNDLFDFEHATAALAYCDAFFTDRSLCALTTARNVSLDQINNCRVTAHVDQAVNVLKEFLNRNHNRG